MRFLRKLIFGRSLRQLILPTGVFFLGVYLLIFSTTYGESTSTFTKRLKLFLTNSENDSKQYISKEFCNPTSIERRAKVEDRRTTKSNNISCRPHVASEEACQLAKELYRTNPALQTCGYSRPVEICTYNLDNVEEGSSTSQIVCSVKDCTKYKRPNVVVWLPSKQTGKLIKKDYIASENELQKRIDGVISEARSKNGSNFMLLECTDSEDGQRAPYDFIGQMFLIPPVPEKEYQQQQSSKTININLVMIDSVARSHFYRSLPRTISTFSKINKYRDVKAEVLDFEMFQSLEGHTAENVHGLFTGKLFPKSFTGQQREQSAVGVGEFLKIWKKSGYKTIYQDDLCFDNFWGMRLDLGTPNSWEEFMKAKSDNFIDSIGRFSLSTLHITRRLSI